MNVKLINYSQSPEGKNLLEQVAFAARVSNPANQNNSETIATNHIIDNQN